MAYKLGNYCELTTKYQAYLRKVPLVSLLRSFTGSLVPVERSEYPHQYANQFTGQDSS